MGGVDRSEPVLRVATPEDHVAIDALMKASAAALFPRYYDERQTASAVQHVAAADPMLLADGTYFVLTAPGGVMVACGGWTRRARLYTGSGSFQDEARILDPATEPAKIRAMFVRPDWTRRGLGRRIIEASEAAARREGYQRLALMATLPGVPLYLACGFEPMETVDVVLTDGIILPCISMEKPIDPPEPSGAMSAGAAGARST